MLLCFQKIQLGDPNEFTSIIRGDFQKSKFIVKHSNLVPKGTDFFIRKMGLFKILSKYDLLHFHMMVLIFLLKST